MKLITKTIEKTLPALYSTENTAMQDTKLYVKLFTPWSDWTWYIAEYDPETKMAFGWVHGFEKEWGYFSIPELEEIKGQFGLKVEREFCFTPKLAKDIKE